jgi:hypothetical protein
VETFFEHACNVAIFAIFAMSLNVLLGYAGQISIAHAAFGAVGAYMAGYFITQHGWSFFPAFGVGVAGAFAVGALTSLPALYLDPRYLILLTLALSTAVLAVIGAIPELGGSYGLRGVPDLKIFGTTFNQPSEFFRPLIVIALLVLLPETAAAVRAALRNRMQTSLNLALGSALASIGLTIPAVAAVSIFIGLPLALGLDAKGTALLAVTLLISTTTLATGRATVLQGAVHLVLFAAFLFLSVVP